MIDFREDQSAPRYGCQPDRARPYACRLRGDERPALEAGLQRSAYRQTRRAVPIRPFADGAAWRGRATCRPGGGCPKCRKNARIKVERAREIGERAGVDLLDTDVGGGSQMLHWCCRICGVTIQKPYRQMRSLRRCHDCARGEGAAQLVALRGTSMN